MILSTDQIHDQTELMTTSGPHQRLHREASEWLRIRRRDLWDLINPRGGCLMLKDPNTPGYIIIVCPSAPWCVSHNHLGLLCLFHSVSKMFCCCISWTTVRFPSFTVFSFVSFSSFEPFKHLNIFWKERADVPMVPGLTACLVNSCNIACFQRLLGRKWSLNKRLLSIQIIDLLTYAVCTGY